MLHKVRILINLLTIHTAKLEYMLVTCTLYTPIHLRADRTSSSTQGAKKHLILQNQQGKFSSIC